MARLIDGRIRRRQARVVISHTHNQRVVEPSHGQPLPPAGLSRPLRDARAAPLRRSRPLRRRRQRRPARSVAARSSDALDARSGADDRRQPRHRRRVHGRIRSTLPSWTSTGELRMNPLYTASSRTASRSGSGCTSRPPTTRTSTAPAGGTCPDEIVVGSGVARRAARRALPADLDELVRRRVILDLPRAVLLTIDGLNSTLRMRSYSYLP